MYIPKGFHWAGPVLTVLTGFAVREHYGAHWDIFAFVQLPLAVIASEWGAYIWQAGTAYQNYLTRNPKPAAEPGPVLDWNTNKPVENVSDGMRPLIRVDGKPHIAYSQTVRSVKEDKVRYVAFTLIRQRDNGFPVDLTEKRWVKNWKFSREEFLSDVIDPWKHHGAIARAGERRNAPYGVIRWDVIQLYAQGEKLPPPPR
jgi:hypothetical protein